jgi:hypothetical protein
MLGGEGEDAGDNHDIDENDAGGARSTASPSTTATKMLPAYLLALLLAMLAGEGGGGFASFRLV